VHNPFTHEGLQTGIEQVGPVHCVPQLQLLGETHVPWPEQTVGSVAAILEHIGIEQVVPVHDDVQTQLFGAVQVPCETPEQAVELVAGCPEQIGIVH
jgi:hypothetical protein